MYRLLLSLFLLCGALVAGCGGSNDGAKKSGEPGQMKNDGPKQWLTAENFRLIQPKVMDKVSIIPLLGGPGRPTNEEIPGLLGETLVWEEGGRKVYVSFDRTTGKVTGATKSGF
jgi:hypothetical protein